MSDQNYEMKSIKRKLQAAYFVIAALLIVCVVIGIYAFSAGKETSAGKESGEKLTIKIEGEDIEKVTVSAGTTEKQPMQNFGQQWSSHRQLWWNSASPSDNLKAILSVTNAGTYQLKAQFTKADDYGIFEIYLNGKKIKEAIDFYNSRVDVTGIVNLGSHELKAGDNEFKVIIIGANPTAVQKFMFGLDYIELVQQD